MGEYNLYERVGDTQINLGYLVTVLALKISELASGNNRENIYNSSSTRNKWKQLILQFSDTLINFHDQKHRKLRKKLEGRKLSKYAQIKNGQMLYRDCFRITAVLQPKVKEIYSTEERIYE